jgi:tryptophan synthase beta chain
MKRFFSRKEEYIPTAYYNIKADLPELPKPPLHPGTMDPIGPADLLPIFSESYIKHETSLDKNIKIPEVVLDKYSLYRPTPFIYAKGLKEYLDTPAEIFYKYEGVGPMGSHKSNSAIIQAYMASQEGIQTLTTETGAGQWGSALAHAGNMFGLNIKVFMVRTSYRSKPGRKVMMQLHNATVTESPSNSTEAGRKFLAEDSDHPGSLGIAISEAVELALNSEGVRYSLGSVLDSVLLHQTIIGQEAILQLNEVGVFPDIIIGCVGGGSNFAGLSFPFMYHQQNIGNRIRFIAVEPEACPTLTKGKLCYDFGDASGHTPLLYMHSLGKDFIPPAIHAGGLRYHGMSPLISHLHDKKMIEAKAVSQEKVFDAAKVFIQTEGILPAPESSHAIAAVIEEALIAKKENKKKVIVFNLSGHGYFDFNAYAVN